MGLSVLVDVLDHGKGLPLPDYQTEGAAGLDLYAALDEKSPLVFKPFDRHLVPTGLKLAIPQGYEGQVRARSGLAFKQGLTLVNGIGTIDADYRGELFVAMINLSTDEVSVKRGDRIAQLVISALVHVEMLVVDKLSQTVRNDQGFGSTGV